ncbi:hypothetical protein HPULCUR_009230 [Helicostylum pulchrum]|uniref:Uncharacterized protein n=1 Tax=Helicostylum pulchrum TaxID=562976 RepID=A0ABP9Y9V1_9FUNG
MESVKQKDVIVTTFLSNILNMDAQEQKTRRYSICSMFVKTAVDPDEVPKRGVSMKNYTDKKPRC